jgi:hypothetical protein
MYPYDDPADCTPVPQMNSDLQHAHLELVSAHCAVHQLRLHYTADDLARFGRRDVLRKSAEAARAISDFYTAIEKKVPPPEPHAAPAQPGPELVTEAVGWLCAHLRQQRALYLSVAVELGAHEKDSLRPYFSSDLLDRVRVVELKGARVEVPQFFARVRSLGFEPPEITHMDSLTFIDVIAFNQRLTDRALFHSLVHAVQIQMLGLEQYARLWIQGFVRTRTHFTVPLEVHAFSLASKFLRPPAERFSVEESVLGWVEGNRY